MESERVRFSVKGYARKYNGRIGVTCDSACLQMDGRGPLASCARMSPEGDRLPRPQPKPRFDERPVVDLLIRNERFRPFRMVVVRRVYRNVLRGQS